MTLTVVLIVLLMVMTIGLGLAFVWLEILDKTADEHHRRLQTLEKSVRALSHKIDDLGDGLL